MTPPYSMYLTGAVRWCKACQRDHPADFVCLSYGPALVARIERERAEEQAHLEQTAAIAAARRRLNGKCS